MATISYLSNSIIILRKENDQTCYRERKHKLKPCPDVSSESIEETGFHSNIQVKPCNEQGCGINASYIRSTDIYWY